MSIVSHIHTVVPFVAGKSEALSGQRLARVGYKSTKKNPAKYKNVCASVPMIDMDAVQENIDRLETHLVEWLEEVQDAVIKGIYEGKNGTLESVTDEDISVESIIAYLDAKRSGGRMNKEMIENWFTDHLEENLTVRIAELTGATEEEQIAKQVQPIVNGYKGMLAALATGVTVYPEDKVRNLIRALELADSEGHTVEQQLSARLNTMLAPKKEKAQQMIMENL